MSAKTKEREQVEQAYQAPSASSSAQGAELIIRSVLLTEQAVGLWTALVSLIIKLRVTTYAQLCAHRDSWLLASGYSSLSWESGHTINEGGKALDAVDSTLRQYLSVLRNGYGYAKGADGTFAELHAAVLPASGESREAYSKRVRRSRKSTRAVVAEETRAVSKSIHIALASDVSEAMLLRIGLASPSLRYATHDELETIAVAMEAIANRVSTSAVTQAA